MKLQHLILSAILAGPLLLAAGCGSDKGPQSPPVVLPGEDSPPLTPSGFSVSLAQDGATVLTWTPNAEPDISGYRVYRYEPDPARTYSYVLQNTRSLIAETSYTCSISIGELVWMRVSAMDLEGHESALSPPIQVEVPNQPTTDSGKDPVYTEQDPSGDSGGRGHTTGPRTSGDPSGHDPTSLDPGPGPESQ